MADPVMSPGSMSGVHCTRCEVALIDCEIARASIDFPVPGTSSNRTWPSHMMARRELRTTSALPLMTVSTLARIASKFCLKTLASISPPELRPVGLRTVVVAIGLGSLEWVRAVVLAGLERVRSELVRRYQA